MFFNSKRNRRHISTQLRVEGGRIAGNGIVSDDYSENSFPDENPFKLKVKFVSNENEKDLSGKVKRYHLTEEELERYRSM